MVCRGLTSAPKGEGKEDDHKEKTLTPQCSGSFHGV